MSKKRYKCIVCGEEKAYAEGGHCDDCTIEFFNQLHNSTVDNLVMKFFSVFGDDVSPKLKANNEINWLEEFWDAIEGKTGPIRW